LAWGCPKTKLKVIKNRRKKRKKEKRFAFELGRSKIFQLPMTVYRSIHFKYFNEIAFHSDGHGGPSPNEIACILIWKI
jgi:hypothetical protein